MRHLLITAVLSCLCVGNVPTAPEYRAVAEIIELNNINQNQWAISKQQMAQIMNVPVTNISDKVMDDFTRMVDTYNFNQINIAYILGQVRVESGGLKHAVEINPGWKYEWRRDLGNIYQGDGPRYAGGGFLQISGRVNYTGFYNYMKSQGIDDPKIISVGKTHVGKHYPWTSAGWWWMRNNMFAYCNKRPNVDRVGAKVNGRYLPNHYEQRRFYTNRAINILGV